MWILDIHKHFHNFLVQSFADAVSQQWLACGARRVSWKQTELEPVGNEWMQSPIIPDHPSPDWGNSRLCLRASPIVFSYQDTLMPVMHGKQLGPVDIILTQSCVNNSAGLRGGLRWQSHILNTGDTVLVSMNPCVRLTVLCSKSYWKSLSVHQQESFFEMIQL